MSDTVVILGQHLAYRQLHDDLPIPLPIRDQNLTQKLSCKGKAVFGS